MTAEDESRGRHFEALIGLMLDALANIHPERVEVTRRPLIEPGRAGGLTPAFELSYRLDDRRRSCLIACEDGSAGLAGRPAEPEGRAEALRVMYLYHFDPLDDDLRRTLEAAWVEPHSLVAFGVFLDGINCALAKATDLDAAVFRLELMKAGRRYPALRTAFSRMRSDGAFAGQVEA